MSTLDKSTPNFLPYYLESLKSNFTFTTNNFFNINGRLSGEYILTEGTEG
jgi:hypothetical protein